MPNGDKHNILFITDDQHRADCLGVAGHPVVQTPHLDQLAYEGVRFTAAYADCPICIPSRCSMISGLHASTYARPWFFRHQPFPIDSSNTMMSLLTSAGYQTQAVGKMHFFPERACYGFENMILDLDYSDWLEGQGYRCGAFTSRGLGLNEFWPTPSIVPAHMTSTAWIVDESIRFLRRRDPTRPFFLWTSFHKPHPPLDPPEPYYSMYCARDMAPPAIGDWVDDPPYAQRLHRESNKYDLIRPDTVSRIRSAYFGLITEIDHQLGRLFGVMKQLDLLDDTLILFTSDHGEMLGDHRDFGKETLYDASARVPFIVRWPHGYRPERRGVECDAPIALADVMPSLVEFAGGTCPEGIDGISVLGLADGTSSGQHDVIRCEVSYGGGLFGLTDGKVKYLWYGWEGREQLFDLVRDPAECHDLAGSPESRDLLEDWRQRLVEWLKCRDNGPVSEGQLEPSGRPWPDAREVRGMNPLGWSFNRPFS